MKKIIILLLTVGILFSCTDEFGDINTDPDVITDIPTEALFTYVEKKLGDYKGAEWYHDNHQIMTWLQYVSGDQGNANDINSLEPRGGKYGLLYTDILVHLEEVRRQISLKSASDQEKYKKLGAITYIVQAFHGLRVTDLFGSIPYTQAAKARIEGIFNPDYDDQATLFDTWIAELDDAIAVLDESQVDDIDLLTADFIYGGDWDKWIKAANAIKLRIALRLESQNLTKAQSIIASVVSDGRLISSMDDEFTYNIAEGWRGTGGADMDWKGRLWAAKPMVEYMKTTLDPRLRVFYQPNGYHQATLDDISANSQTVPPAIDVDNDNAVLYTAADGEDILGYRYIGAPVDRNDPDKNDYSYIENPTTVGINATQLAKYNQRLIMNVGYNYGDGAGEGTYVDVFISYAEVCFMMSEFILKGYTSGDAEDWYEKGVRASIETYEMIADIGQLDYKIAGKSYPRVPIADSETEAYLLTPEVAFDGVNDLEKVYIQQYLNFYRLPDEGWVLARRTGYPKFGSSILARGYVNGTSDLQYPRRMPTPDPGDLNRVKWEAASAAQGISVLLETPSVLNTERLWWDKNNPAIGSGGN
ncbi:SusD/RagB family nutrient-binding outer membrane lipoprotein [Reichenbachiella sp. MALMAid0571]|uniref:SusD/RagB family nutrient-binding outer membrane lipoprotein n=1 Tax=Reichenbachiella sp. MALMAid0571 TaxID=3143939 RepID=UPI0032DF8870